MILPVARRGRVLSDTHEETEHEDHHLSTTDNDNKIFKIDEDELANESETPAVIRDRNISPTPFR